ncbi:hypothetical protein [Brevibacillus centrosporus]|uniref:hypothetical protein n=1 Tax=Brevibacillus centrosporus TaxID=54910 RepID=UPI002E20E684|nr:hypothetical protein [Brevibacillus centrosporus]
MDAKKILYKYKQFGEAKRTAEITIKTLEERNSRKGADENWWIRGSLPKNVVEAAFLKEEDLAARVDYLQWMISELNRIIDAVERAKDTLNEEQQEIIDRRYFKGQSVTQIQTEMRVSHNKYNYLHKESLESMQLVLTPLCIDDAFLDMLIFTPYSERFEEANRKRVGSM